MCSTETIYYYCTYEELVYVLICVFDLWRFSVDCNVVRFISMWIGGLD